MTYIQYKYHHCFCSHRSLRHIWFGSLALSTRAPQRESTKCNRDQPGKLRCAGDLVQWSDPSAKPAHGTCLLRDASFVLVLKYRLVLEYHHRRYLHCTSVYLRRPPSPEETKLHVPHIAAVGHHEDHQCEEGDAEEKGTYVGGNGLPKLR